MNDQIIICNTFKGEVDFLNTRGGSLRHIPSKIEGGRFADRDYQPNEPCQCTVLHTGQTVLLDNNGITVFCKFRSISQVAILFVAQKPNPNTKLCNYSTARLSQQYSSRGGRAAKCYGLFATRQNKVGTYLKDDKAGDLIAWIENIHKDVEEWELSETKIDFGCMTTVRFAACQGTGAKLVTDCRRNFKTFNFMFRN